MTDRSTGKDCGCGAGNVQGGAGSAARGDAIARLVKAQVPQAQHARFNVRIVPARSLDTFREVQARCQPRGHASGGWNAGQAVVDTALLDALAGGDKAMLAWLAKDVANAKRFLAEPVAAMAEAGVALTRAQQKTFARASEEVAAVRKTGAAADAPSVDVQVFPDGRVGAIGTHKPGDTSDDFGCGPKRKG